MTGRARVRSDALIYGVALFVWMGREDNAVWTAAAFGVGLMWIMARGQHPTAAPPSRYRLLIPVVRGALIGGGAAVAAAALMLLKNGLHAHVFPDYPAAVIGAMIARAPVWAAAGGIAGLGWGLWGIRQQPSSRILTP
jgi:hypothetical protein